MLLQLPNANFSLISLPSLPRGGCGREMIVGTPFAGPLLPGPLDPRDYPPISWGFAQDLGVSRRPFAPLASHHSNGVPLTELMRHALRAHVIAAQITICTSPMSFRDGRFQRCSLMCAYWAVWQGIWRWIWQAWAYAMALFHPPRFVPVQHLCTYLTTYTCCKRCMNRDATALQVQYNPSVPMAQTSFRRPMRPMRKSIWQSANYDNVRRTIYICDIASQVWHAPEPCLCSPLCKELQEGSPVLHRLRVNGQVQHKCSTKR